MYLEHKGHTVIKPSFLIEHNFAKKNVFIILLEAVSVTIILIC